MNDGEAIYRLLDETNVSLIEFASGRHDAGSRSLAEAFAADFYSETKRPASATLNRSQDVRGLRYGPLVLDSEATGASALLDAARGAFTYARWTEFYRETPWSQPFLGSFATGECIGSVGRFESNAITLGLFVLGPDTLYPAHAHPAEEFYIVVAGEAEFQKGAKSEFVNKRKDDAIFHASDVSHAIRTTSQPMLAVYGWRGQLKEPSWFRSDMGDETEAKQYPVLI